MRLLAQKLKSVLCHNLCSGPHFGFLPWRAATDAINRVALHCREIRALVSAHRRAIAQQILQTQKLTICGGISLYLDLTRDFGSVSRDLLFRHLHELGTPEDLQCLISAWHEPTHYNLVFQGQTCSIPVGKGVRCKIAPLLCTWTAFCTSLHV